jgi:hypothetical protein
MTEDWRTARLFLAYCPACKPFIEEGLKESLTITAEVGPCCLFYHNVHQLPINKMNTELQCKYIQSPTTIVKFTNDVRRRFLRFVTS